MHLVIGRAGLRPGQELQSLPCPRQEGDGNEEIHYSQGRANPAKHNLAMDKRASCQQLGRKKFPHSVQVKKDRQDLGEP
jgi:hypothetical protein